MTSRLFEARDALAEKLRNLPGFRAVGVTKSLGKPAFVVSVDQTEFRGTTPEKFRGYRVTVRDFGEPSGHAWGGTRWNN
jgi:hypothetical protein